MSLVIDGLRKRFGTVRALDGLDLVAPRGQVFGFLGANGAGKTTTMRIVLGVLRADAGQISWNGAPHDRHDPPPVSPTQSHRKQVFAVTDPPREEGRPARSRPCRAAPT